MYGKLQNRHNHYKENLWLNKLPNNRNNSILNGFLPRNNIAKCLPVNEKR